MDNVAVNLANISLPEDALVNKSIMLAIAYIAILPSELIMPNTFANARPK